jgi:hypothetical protein
MQVPQARTWQLATHSRAISLRRLQPPSPSSSLHPGRQRRQPSEPGSQASQASSAGSRRSQPGSAGSAGTWGWRRPSRGAAPRGWRRRLRRAPACPRTAAARRTSWPRPGRAWPPGSACAAARTAWTCPARSGSSGGAGWGSGVGLGVGGGEPSPVRQLLAWVTSTNVARPAQAAMGAGLGGRGGASHLLAGAQPGQHLRVPGRQRAEHSQALCRDARLAGGGQLLGSCGVPARQVTGLSVQRQQNLRSRAVAGSASGAAAALQLGGRSGAGPAAGPRLRLAWHWCRRWLLRWASKPAARATTRSSGPPRAGGCACARAWMAGLSRALATHAKVHCKASHSSAKHLRISSRQPPSGCLRAELPPPPPLLLLAPSPRGCSAEPAQGSKGTPQAVAPRSL